MLANKVRTLFVPIGRVPRDYLIGLILKDLSGFQGTYPKGLILKDPSYGACLKGLSGNKRAHSVTKTEVPGPPFEPSPLRFD